MDCPLCRTSATKTNWLPDEGFDPHLRQYQCDNPGCGLKFYTLGRMTASKTADIKAILEKAWL